MRAIVHIGTPKTGSSAIQDALAGGNDRLLSEGVLAFSSDRLTESALFMAFERPDAALNPEVRLHFTSLDEARAWSWGEWKKLETATAKYRPHTVVLSSEHFINILKPEDLLKKLRKSFSEIKCVGYLRDPVSFYTSQLDQLMRGGTPLRDFPGVNKFNFHHVNNFLNFRNVFGADNVIVRPFTRDRLVGGDVVADFENVLTQIVGSNMSLPRRPPTNESIPGLVTALCAAVNAQTNPGGLDYRRRKTLIQSAREDGTLKSAPRLDLKGTRLETALLLNSRHNCQRADEIFFGGEAVYPITEASTDDLKGVDLWRELADWLSSYVADPLVRSVVRSMLVL